MLHSSDSILQGSYGLESQGEEYQYLGRSGRVMENQGIFSRKLKGQGKYGLFALWAKEKSIIFYPKSQGKSGNYFLETRMNPDSSCSCYS